MKIIFLDFDGVITIPPKWYINIDKLKILKRIIDATNAKIVISSSWRCGEPPSLELTINKMIGHPKRCPKNKMLNWFIDNLYDVTPLCSGCRGNEINAYLREHSEIDNYVILDDDGDMLDEQLFHFVQTDYQTGLTSHEEELAIKVLNNKYVWNLLGLNYEIRDAWRKKYEGEIDRWNEIIKYNDLIDKHEEI